MRINQDLAMSQLYYSKVLIKPLYGRPKEISLNRTMYEIRSNHHEEMEHKDWSISLPAFEAEDFKYQLDLVKEKSSNHFVLTSLCKDPFKINGNLVFKGIISHGDKVDIGHNRFEFSYSRPSIVDREII